MHTYVHTDCVCVWGSAGYSGYVAPPCLYCMGVQALHVILIRFLVAMSSVSGKQLMRSKNKLKKAALNIIASQMSEAEIADLRDP